MSAPKPSIVVFPGAWHPASCMDAFTQTLGDEGFEAHAFALASAFGDAGKGMRDDEDAMRRAVLSVLDAGRDVLFIVHSYAGYPGAGVMAELAKANRVARGLRNGIVGVIYMASFIPLAGHSIYECLGRTWQPWMSVDVSCFFLLFSFFFFFSFSLFCLVCLRFWATHILFTTAFQLTCLLQQKSETIDTVDRQQTFYNDCEEGVTKAMDPILGLQSVRSFTDKVEVTGWKDEAYHGHRAYIRCLQDNAIPIQVQDALIQASEVDWVIKTLDASHSPFLSMPKDLAKVLSEIHQQFSVG